MTDILQDAVNALVLAKGNISEASRALGLPRPTLNSRLEMVSHILCLVIQLIKDYQKN